MEARLVFLGLGTTDDPQTLDSLKTVKHGGASIMIWSCFSHCDRSVYHLPGVMDQSEYIKILRGNVLEMGVSTRRRPQTHQSEAASWFQTNQVNHGETSSVLDLDPVENSSEMQRNCWMWSSGSGLGSLITGDRGWWTP